MSDCPHSKSSERAILGAIFLDGETAFEQCSRLKEEMFSLDSHRKIYNTINFLFNSSISIDTLSVVEELKKKGISDSIGGLAYVAGLTEGIPRHFDISRQIDIVIEKWKLRRGIEICNRALASLTDTSPEPSEDILVSMQSDIFDAIGESASRIDPSVISYSVKVLDETLDYSKPPMGMSQGHKDLDDFTFGMQPGEVTVVGARSGVGKSSLMIQSAYVNIRRGNSVDIFSLEMHKTNILWRLWSLDSGIPYNSIRRKLLNDTEKRLVRESAYRIADMPLRIHDNGDMTLTQIVAESRLSVRRNKAKLVIVDYAQIVNTGISDDYKRVSTVSRTLTKMAKAEGVHLMLLSQLRRVPPQFYNQPPTLLDLRDSGQLDNDAHCVVLIHRGWNSETKMVDLEGEFIIPKQRNGATGSIPTYFDYKNLTFRSEEK